MLLRYLNYYSRYISFNEIEIIYIASENNFKLSAIITYSLQIVPGKEGDFVSDILLYSNERYLNFGISTREKGLEIKLK
jgi:hypothetical protein